MKFTEKTVIAVYIQATIAVLIAAMVFRQRIEEAFQTAAVPAPVVKCINGANQCRYIDAASTTDTSYVIREKTNTTPSYADCPKTTDNKDKIFNPETLMCDPPSGSTDTVKSTVDLTKVKCGFEEAYEASLKSCTKIAGRISNCIPENATESSEEVKKNMICYANKHEDVKKKFGNDIKLLFQEYRDNGRYRLEDPCCDAESRDCPAGHFCIFGYTIEKDWKFWTVFSIIMLLIVIFVWLIIRRI